MLSYWLGALLQLLSEGGDIGRFRHITVQPDSNVPRVMEDIRSDSCEVTLRCQSAGRKLLV